MYHQSPAHAWSVKQNQTRCSVAVAERGSRLPADLRPCPRRKVESTCMTEPVLDCQSCGACCRASAFDPPRKPGQDWEPFVVVTEGEAQSLITARPGSVVLDKEDKLWSMQVKQDCHGSCAALEGSVGQSVSCSVYDCRPIICREFQPGDEQCLHARERAGIKT